MALRRWGILRRETAKKEGQKVALLSGPILLTVLTVSGLALALLYYTTFYHSDTMGSITGIIRSSSHAPLEEVNVLIVSGPPHPDMAAVTGTDGRFSFNSLRPGKYLLKAYGQVESDEIPVEVLAKQIPLVEIWLETNQVSKEDTTLESKVINKENSSDFNNQSPEEQGRPE